MMDVQSLTLGEVDFLETQTGMSINAAEDPNSFKGKFLASLVYLFKHREDNSFTLNDAMKMSITEATSYLGLGGDELEDPKGKGQKKQPK